MSRSNFLFFLFITAFSLFTFSLPSGFSAEIHVAGPGQTVRLLSSQLLEIKNSRSSSTLQEQSSVIIREYVAINLIAPHIYGREYPTLTNDQKQKLNVELLGLMEKNLTNIIQKNEFSLPEKITEVVRESRGIAKFSIIQPPKSTHYMFVMRKSENKWQIFDVNINGASMLKNFMYQIRPVIQREGFTGAIRKLQELSTKLKLSRDNP